MTVPDAWRIQVPPYLAALTISALEISIPIGRKESSFNLTKRVPLSSSNGPRVTTPLAKAAFQIRTPKIDVAFRACGRLCELPRDDPSRWAVS
jgi:hypothetical protein